ncbi:MAG: D-alanyl-D-alanine carboxypeptidase/D-alanyl-D-alanine-endopeptidase [Phycisphaerae bacterium]|nr:D-alanyl-D-alanine carboxypeptidase/D-alanyl-D-alanine-endopeptidase [Gemmatimonadaceae bacterium]
MSVDSMLADVQWKNAHWGILIVDPATGDTLYAHNADKLFMPASNQKIVTGAVGLAQLGADFRWRTTVELRGVTSGSMFTGNIVLHGRGDPSWSNALRAGDASAALAPIADALKARGISRIVGNIVAEGNAFSDEPYGFGWAFDDFDFGYSAPVDELFYNEGFFTVKVKAGVQKGQTVMAVTQPLKAYPKLMVRALARDRADSVGENRDLEAKWDSTASGVVITGTLPMGDSASIDLAYRHPNDAALAAVHELLAARKIVVVSPKKSAPARKMVERELPPGGVQVERMPTPGAIVRGMDTLVVLQSPTLRDVLKRVEKPSQNQIAEILFKTVALERTGFGRADSARAVVQRQLVEWGIPPEAVAVRDGSGLSRHDYIAPRTLVKILDTMRRSPMFDAFYASLPIAGVDGTIATRMRNTPAANNVHAKTGTVDKARSLSGFVTTADGQMLIFSLLCNNYTVPTRSVERVQDAIAVRLASMRIREWQ